MRTTQRAANPFILAFSCFVVAASILSVPIPGAAGERTPSLWVRKALPQGAFEGTATRVSCSGSPCELPSTIPVSLMLTPRPNGVQVFSLTGNFQMHLGWVPQFGGYLGRRDIGGGWLRQMQLVVDRQVRIDGVPTARRVRVEMTSWERGHPSRVHRYQAVLRRVSSGVDVTIVLDRTGSMNKNDLRNARAGAKAMLEGFPSRQIWVGLAALPYGRSVNPCVVAQHQAYPAPSYEAWEVTALSPDHATKDGHIDRTSQILADMKCLRIAGSPRVTVHGSNRTSAGHTNLGDPLHGANQMVNGEGRSDAPDVIVLVSDGGANQPDGMGPCRYFVDAAAKAKRTGATVFTLGFKVAHARCTRDRHGRFRNAYGSAVLAAAATRSTDDEPGGCAADENRDGDHYFCRDNGTSLIPAFRRIAAATLGVVPRSPCRIGCW